jgi:hypothetical protein
MKRFQKIKIAVKIVVEKYLQILLHCVNIKQANINIAKKKNFFLFWMAANNQ